MPRPGPTSSTTSSGSRPARRPITPRMFSSTRKCWPSCFFGATAHSAEGGGRRWRRSARRARPRPRRAPRRARRACARRWPARCGLPRTGCGARYGLSVSARRRSAGTLRGGARAARGALRVGDVAGERDVPAALERRLEQRGRREAVEDDGAVEARERGERVLVGVAGVDHDRLAELGGERELRLEEAPLRRRAGRSRGSSRGRSRRRRRRARGEQRAELVEPVARRARRRCAGGCRGSA